MQNSNMNARAEDDEFVSNVAKTVKEACLLMEAGYEYVTECKNEGIKNLQEA